MVETVNTVISWEIIEEQTVPESSVPETYNDYPKDTWRYSNSIGTYNTAYRETLVVSAYNYIGNLEVGTANVSGNVYVLGDLK